MKFNRTALAIVGAVVLTVALATVGTAFAASYFASTVTTAAATSTPAYMVPGGTASSTAPGGFLNGTTTLAYNTLSQNQVLTPPSAGGTVKTKADSIYLAGQFTGSSTSAVLHVYPEYSQDGQDWYQGYGILPSFSTTTPTVTYAYSYTDEITIPYASTTVDQTSTSSIDRFLVQIPAPTMDVRLVMTLTGANGAFWGEIIPAKSE